MENLQRLIKILVSLKIFLRCTAIITQSVIYHRLFEGITASLGNLNIFTVEILNKLGFTTINAAESGVMLSAALTQANEITGATKIATIMLGTNNSAETAATIGQIGDTTNSTIHGQIYLIINKILTEHPAVYFGFITPVPRYRAASERESVRMVSEAIVEACKYYCIPCLDLQTSIGFAEQAKNIYYMDDVHPSAAGTHRMALAIEAWLIDLLGDM